MDQQPNIPKISPEVNREERKRGGLAGLFSRLGLGSGGAGGSGGMGGALGAGVSGGLLATKAGIIALILAGTTVAGSLGVVAYKIFGPSAADRSDASFESIFAAKPKSAQTAAGKSAAAPDGVSQSLQYLVQANGKQEAPAQAQNAAAAATAATGGASGTAAAPPPLRNDSAASQGAAAKFKTDRKFGELAKGATSGSGGSFSVPGGAGGGAAPLLASAKGGHLSGAMSAPRPGMGNLSALTSRRGGTGGANPLRQLGQVYRQQQGAQSSRSAGLTYDGSTPAGVSDGSPGGGAGAQSGAADSNPALNPSAGNYNQQYPGLDKIAGENVTPWQSAINTAAMAVMGAAALLFIAGKIASAGWNPILTKILVGVLCGVALVLSGLICKLGAEMVGGVYNQHLQGQLLQVAGGFLAATAAMMMGSALLAPATTDGLAGAMSGTMGTLMTVAGGAAVAATAWAYLASKNTYPPSQFKDGQPPDDNPLKLSQSSMSPSEKILERYLA